MMNHPGCLGAPWTHPPAVVLASKMTASSINTPAARPEMPAPTIATLIALPLQKIAHPAQHRAGHQWTREWSFLSVAISFGSSAGNRCSGRPKAARADGGSMPPPSQGGPRAQMQPCRSQNGLDQPVAPPEHQQRWAELRTAECKLIHR